MEHTLAILITCHNDGELLRQCLESLLPQANGPEEVLIFDDASDMPASRFVPEDSRIVVERSERNVGPSAGRNALLRRSRSDYVHFHDADDMFSPEWCRLVRHEIEQAHPDAVFTEISTYRGSSLPSQSTLVSGTVLGLERLAEHGDLLRFCIEGYMLTPAGTYRRQTVVATGGYPEEYWQSEDFYFHCAMALGGISYRLIRQPLVSVRIRHDSRSQNVREVRHDTLRIVERLAREVPPQYSVYLADKAMAIGSELLTRGCRLEAAEAFRLGLRIGPPAYAQATHIYRALARIVGPWNAEQLRTAYRRILPPGLRKAFRRVL
jgi:glycosyltransferase involved in cell wall biosynthesis